MSTDQRHEASVHPPSFISPPPPPDLYLNTFNFLVTVSVLSLCCCSDVIVLPAWCLGVWSAYCVSCTVFSTMGAQNAVFWWPPTDNVTKKVLFVSREVKYCVKVILSRPTAAWWMLWWSVTVVEYVVWRACRTMRSPKGRGEGRKKRRHDSWRNCAPPVWSHVTMFICIVTVIYFRHIDSRSNIFYAVANTLSCNGDVLALVCHSRFADIYSNITHASDMILLHSITSYMLRLLTPVSSGRQNEE